MRRILVYFGIVSPKCQHEDMKDVDYAIYEIAGARVGVLTKICPNCGRVLVEAD